MKNTIANVCKFRRIIFFVAVFYCSPGLIDGQIHLGIAYGVSEIEVDEVMVDFPEYESLSVSLYTQIDNWSLSVNFESTLSFTNNHNKIKDLNNVYFGIGYSLFSGYRLQIPIMATYGMSTYRFQDFEIDKAFLYRYGVSGGIRFYLSQSIAINATYYHHQLRLQQVNDKRIDGKFRGHLAKKQIGISIGL